MTIWDYLDKHELVGTFVVLVMGYLVLVVIESVFVSFAKAWGVRKSNTREDGNG